MSVKATRRKPDRSAKEFSILQKNINAECSEICQVCKVMDLADSLHREGWHVKVKPFEDVPLLVVRAKKKRSNH